MMCSLWNQKEDGSLYGIKKRMVLFTVVTDTGTESMFFKRLLSSNISL
jgi:hypothetical protein